MKFLFLFLIVSCYSNAQTVYKTPSGKKYHTATCRMVENVSQKMSVTDAAQVGLLPCKICQPPISGGLNLVGRKQANGEASTVQCNGTTKAGTRCKHKTSIANGFCFQHDPSKSK